MEGVYIFSRLNGVYIGTDQYRCVYDLESTKDVGIFDLRQGFISRGYLGYSKLKKSLVGDERGLKWRIQTPTQRLRTT